MPYALVMRRLRGGMPSFHHSEARLLPQYKNCAASILRVFYYLINLFLFTLNNLFREKLLVCYNNFTERGFK